MITSKDNEKLKLVRKLRDRKWRERERLFVTEGEDLLEAGRAAGAEPALLLTAPDAGLGGEEVEPELLDAASHLGSGTRAIAAWELPGPVAEPAERAGSWVYLHGVGDPGNVGTIVRTAAALADARVALGPGSADPYGPKAVRATMGALFARPPARATIAELPAPRVALVATGAEPVDRVLDPLTGPLTLCLGAEREGLPGEVVDSCELRATIPLRAGFDSLNVAAAAAIALQRISSTGLGDPTT